MTDSTLYKDDAPYKFSYKWHESGKKAIVSKYEENGNAEIIAYYPTGEMNFQIRYVDYSTKEGSWIFYDADGSITSKQQYEKGTLIKTECFTKDGKIQHCLEGIDKTLDKTVLAYKTEKQSPDTQPHGDSISYFVGSNKKPGDPVDDCCYRIAYKENGAWHVTDYFLKSNATQMSGTYVDDDFQKGDGIFKWYHANGKLSKVGAYQNGRKEGLWKSYSEVEGMIDSTLYKNGLPYKYSFEWHENGNSKRTGIYNEDGSGKETGWYENGVIDFEGKISAYNVMDSIWSFNYKNGQTACREYFKIGTLLKMECFTEKGKAENCLVDIDSYNRKKRAIRESFEEGDIEYKYVELMPSPSYPVYQFLSEKIKYPRRAQENAIAGQVKVKFVVDTDGSIIDVMLTDEKPVGGGLDEEALRVVPLLPKWNPGRENNRPVKVHFTLPIRFSL